MEPLPEESGVAETSLETEFLDRSIWTDWIRDIVQEYPGIASREIYERIHAPGTQLSLAFTSSLLRTLEKNGEIYKRRNEDKNYWYPVLTVEELKQLFSPDWSPPETTS